MRFWELGIDAISFLWFLLCRADVMMMDYLFIRLFSLYPLQKIKLFSFLQFFCSADVGPMLMDYLFIRLVSLCPLQKIKLLSFL